MTDLLPTLQLVAPRDSRLNDRTTPLHTTAKGLLVQPVKKGSNLVPVSKLDLLSTFTKTTATLMFVVLTYDLPAFFRLAVA